MVLGAFEGAKGKEIGVSLKTPESIRQLQRKLYVAAKQQPERRFQSIAHRGACVCHNVKPVGEPDAGNPHVRFDERDVETEHG